jgi:hypothetical protein
MKDDNLTTSSAPLDLGISDQSVTAGSTEVTAHLKVGLEEKWQDSWQSVTMGGPQDIVIDGGTSTSQDVSPLYPNRARRVIRRFKVIEQDDEV